MKNKISSISFICFFITSLMAQKGWSQSLLEINCDKIGEHITTIELANRNQRTYAYTIWMSSDAVRSYYLVNQGDFKNVYDRYENWKQKNAFVLGTSCNYVDDQYQQTIGLTIDNGLIVNRKLAKRMDALVVSVDGKISVYDIRKAFRIGEWGRLNIDKDKTVLLNWAKKTKASVFQTHLLAYKQELTITKAANNKVARRKFLAIVYDKKEQKHQVLFYIKKGVYLQKATEKIFNYLKAKGYYIDAMVNLDTGGNDILELNDDLQYCNKRNIKGLMSIHYATNLLVFYEP